MGRLMALYVNSKISKGHHVEDSVFMPHEDMVTKPQMSLEEYLVESFGGGVVVDDDARIMNNT